MTIQAICARLDELAAKLESDELTPDGILEMTTLGRTLHERLIILQYKAFEDQLSPFENSDESPLMASEPAAEPMNAKTPVDATAAHEIEERKSESMEVLHPEKDNETEIETIQTKDEEEEIRPAFRLTDHEVAANQISLIDSIEEIKRMEQSINDTFKVGESPSLAEKFNLKPITNLKKAIGINQRFQFVSVLFDGEKEGFDLAVNRIDTAASYLEADEYVQNTLRKKYDWEMKNPVAKDFIQLIERRFL